MTHRVEWITGEAKIDWDGHCVFCGEKAVRDSLCQRHYVDYLRTLNPAGFERPGAVTWIPRPGTPPRYYLYALLIGLWVAGAFIGATWWAV